MLQDPKAIVLTWPFERLPLGSLVHDRAPENPSFKAVMDGIDVLIKQKVSPSRCRLQVLDLQFTGQKFWNTWTGTHLQAYSKKRELMPEGTSKKEKATPYLEVCVDLYLGEEQVDRFSTYLLNWTKKRKGVHLSYKTVRIHYLTRKYFRFLYAVSCCDIMELGIHCTLPFSTLRMLANLLGMLSNLKRLVVCIKIPIATTPEKAEWRLLSINLSISHLNAPSYFIFKSCTWNLPPSSGIICTVCSGVLIPPWRSSHSLTADLEKKY